MPLSVIPLTDVTNIGKIKTELNDKEKEEANKIIKEGINDPTKLFAELKKEDSGLLNHYVCNQIAEIVAKESLAENPHATNILYLLSRTFRFARCPSDSWAAAILALLQCTEKLTDPQARLYAYDVLAARDNSDDQTPFSFLVSRLDSEASDKLRACIIFLLVRITKLTRDGAKIKKTKDVCKTIVEEKKYGPLTQLSAAVLLLGRGRQEVFVPAINKVSETAADTHKYDVLWVGEKLDADWVTFCGNKGLAQAVFDFAKQEAFTWAPLVQKVLRKLDITIREEHVLPKLIELLKTNSGDTKFIIRCLLFTTFGGKMYPGTYFSELESPNQRLLKVLVDVPTLADSNSLLEAFNIPTDLPAFFSKPIPAELVDTERDAVLESLSKVKWGELHHAFGPATDVPTLIRGIASRFERRRDNAWQGMWAAPLNRGRVFSSTLAIIPFIFQLLKCKLVEEKSRMLEWLDTVVVISPIDRSIIAFHPKMYDLKKDADEEDILRKNCLDEIEKGCDLYLQCLQSNDLDLVLRAMALLVRFPNYDEALGPLLQMQQKSPSAEVRTSALLAVSHLFTWTNSSENLKAALTPVCLNNLSIAHEMHDRNFGELVVQTIALGRLYLQARQAIPDIVFKVIFMAVTREREPLITAFGPSDKLVDKFVEHTNGGFTESLIEKLTKVSADEPATINNLAHYLLNVSFKDSGIAFMTIGGKAPDHFDLDIDDLQAKVLQTFVDCEVLWSAHEVIPKGVLGRLHTLLKLDYPPTRESLRLSLEKRRKNANK